MRFLLEPIFTLKNNVQHLSANREFNDYRSIDSAIRQLID